MFNVKHEGYFFLTLFLFWGYKEQKQDMRDRQARAQATKSLDKNPEQEMSSMKKALDEKLTREELDVVVGGTTTETHEIMTWKFICGKDQMPMDLYDPNCWDKDIEKFVSSVINKEFGVSTGFARCNYNGSRGKSSGNIANVYGFVDNQNGTVKLTHKEFMAILKKQYPAT